MSYSVVYCMPIILCNFQYACFCQNVPNDIRGKQKHDTSFTGLMFTGHELGSLRVSFSVDLITYQISSYACELFDIDVYY